MKIEPSIRQIGCREVTLHAERPSPRRPKSAKVGTHRAHIGPILKKYDWYCRSQTRYGKSSYRRWRSSPQSGKLDVSLSLCFSSIIVLIIETIKLIQKWCKKMINGYDNYSLKICLCVNYKVKWARRVCIYAILVDKRTWPLWKRLWEIVDLVRLDVNTEMSLRRTKRGIVIVKFPNDKKGLSRRQ